MKINFAHVRERARSGGWINFIVFDARSSSGSNNDNSMLLAQLTAKARANSLKVDQAALVSAGVKPTLNDGARLSESLKNKGAAQAPSSSMRSIRTADRAR